ncbi:hypothetical protein AQJ43_02895 [Streptomyces avermitilis]|uniref:Uncharacterized protein n=2 Tax=Streptomyces avermitilis TaxID=33903 RepID=Q82HY2_STRAW|nr:DUF6716 putative glycosyltransferase [Streptomyces avermitilis]MYS98976.1 hypothetical protein [Streptomyces sp. SID5469]KUN56561.1 hypothetical protein AQJ43_02895 [Streptomyces avermitilis]OOV32710.1 hypothetical protein SM007_07875 [Streptomyces avermitilis]BAC71087.1 hypothetical protein SAVERM_3375 [Streptomyces avermitilis MA-4680 = NBRC 14893]GDY76565.1 hypothetical protein SAV31267_060500 [Streptomyces avermitilis]
MPASTTKSLRVAVLADSDTRWKWGALTANRVSPNESDIRLDGFLLRGRATPTPRQLEEVGVRADSLREVTAVEFLRHMKGETYDIVVLALVGGAVQAVLHGLGHARQGHEKRPVVVTGYVGVVYEKLADGLLLRHGADLVLANSRQDAERFRAVFEGVGADASAVTEVALPFLGGRPYAGNDPSAQRGSRPYTVVFAAQPSVPERRGDRTYLLNRLVQHARLHPDREVLLKLRSKPGEHTTHIEELPYQKLAQRLPDGLPANFRLVYGNMGEVLDRSDLLVTVSSTAALESLHRGIPTVVLTDLGVREALGNHHFVGSGCLASWDQLDAGHRPLPDPTWVARQGVAAGGTPSGGGSYETAFDAARERIAGLLAAGELPPLAPYYTPVTAPGYLPGILARHHLAPDGSPLPGAPAADKEPSPVRQMVRRAARGAYRHGVQRVAPVIRRMGEL